MNAKEAAVKICKELKGMEVLGCYEYDNNNYLFSMTPVGTITNEDNFYLFNRFTGTIKEYAILNDIKHFNNVIQDKSKILNFR